MNLLCQHPSRAIGETFSRCLLCQSWCFTIGARWYPASVDLPWVAA
jgi:hypothetical protein